MTSNRFQVLSDGSGFGQSEFDSTPGPAADDSHGTMPTFLQPPQGGVKVRSDQGSCSSSQKGSRKGSQQGSRTNAAPRHGSLLAHGLGKDCKESKCAKGDGPKISKIRRRAPFFTARTVRFCPDVESISYPKGTPCETQFNLYELGSSSPLGCIDSNLPISDPLHMVKRHPKVWLLRSLPQVYPLPTSSQRRPRLIMHVIHSLVLHQNLLTLLIRYWRVVVATRFMHHAILPLCPVLTHVMIIIQNLCSLRHLPMSRTIHKCLFPWELT